MTAPVAAIASVERRDRGIAQQQRIHFEADIIGAAIREPERVLPRLDDLAEGHLFDGKHQIVFHAMRNLAADGKPITELTLEQHIGGMGKLDALGGLSFIVELSHTHFPTDENIDLYRDEIIAVARLREAAIFGSELSRSALSGALEPAEQLLELRASMARFLDDGRRPERDAPAYGRPFIEYIGDKEPGNDAADIFDVHGLLVRGEPSLFIGDPKVGKTMLITDLLLHAAAGRREWMGLPIYRRLHVLLFLREDSDRTTKRRIWQLARGAGIELWELHDHLVIDGTSPLYLDDAKLTAKLERQLTNFDVCAIDSLSTVHNGDENSAESMSPIMNRWRDLSLGTNTSLPIVHHFRKRGTDGNAAATGGNVLQRARGSSIIGATTRHAVGVERGPEEHQVVLSVESNHEVDTEPFVIRRRFGEDDRGRKWIKHERAGSLIDARTAKDVELIDGATLHVVREAGPAGVGKGRELRAAVIERLTAMPRGRGCRPIKVDQSAERLRDAGAIRLADGRWKVA